MTKQRELPAVSSAGIVLCLAIHPRRGVSGLTLKWLHSWWLTSGICLCLLQNVKQGMIFPSFEPALWGSSAFTGWKEKSALGGNAPLWEWTLNQYGNEPGSRCIWAKFMPFHTQVFLWPILSSFWNLQIPVKVVLVTYNQLCLLTTLGPYIPEVGEDLNLNTIFRDSVSGVLVQCLGDLSSIGLTFLVKLSPPCPRLIRLHKPVLLSCVYWVRKGNQEAWT